MPAEPGHETGHEPVVGFTWEDYLSWLVGRAGSLTVLAERLCAARGYDEDVASIERALRRLRARGLGSGGKWGTRLVAMFGLPDAVVARVRWMGAYHSRFTDLPVAVAEDILRLWEHPPTVESPAMRVWLALARATLALRRDDLAAAAAQLGQARLQLGSAPPEAAAELLLVEAYVASRTQPSEVPRLLAAVEPLLEGVEDADERQCLFARLVDQLAYDLNKGRTGPPDYSAAEALYRRIPVDGAPPFVLCRRANGLAYARWRQGAIAEAAALAREACRQAGDGGHVRLRAMALSMLARIEGEPGGAEARERALAISQRLEDETLRLRFERARR